MGDAFVMIIIGHVNPVIRIQQPDLIIRLIVDFNSMNINVREQESLSTRAHPCMWSADFLSRYGCRPICKLWEVADFALTRRNV